MNALLSPFAVRRAIAADAPLLSRLGRETFRETWLEDHRMPYAPEDAAAFVEEAYGLPAIERLLADPACASWLAEDERSVPLGFALAGPCTLPYPDVQPDDGELKRLYVLRAARGSRVGAALFDAALAWLERHGPRRIWLGVWSGNEGAQRFYARAGFAHVGEHVFPVGRTLDREFAMRRG